MALATSDISSRTCELIFFMPTTIESTRIVATRTSSVEMTKPASSAHNFFSKLMVSVSPEAVPTRPGRLDFPAGKR